MTYGNHDYTALKHLGETDVTITDDYPFTEWVSTGLDTGYFKGSIGDPEAHDWYPDDWAS